jgi:hypothetical protein
MTEDNTMTNCRTCFMSIGARAKKCPHCHAFQGLVRYLVLWGILALLLMLGGSILWFDYLLYNRTNVNGPDIPGAIQIGESRLFFTPAFKGDAVSIIGRIKNLATIPIVRTELEVQIFNEEGNLIDSFRSTLYSHLEPGAEESFKITSDEAIHAERAEYAKHEIFVRKAQSR